MEARHYADVLRAVTERFRTQVGASSLQLFNELPRLAGTSGTPYNSEAYSVNRFGQVVGRVQNDSGAYRAFLSIREETLN